MACFAAGHKTHQTEEINVKAEQVCTKLKGDIGKIKEKNKRYQKEKEKCQIGKELFLKHVTEIEFKISSRMKELIQLVTSHGNLLLQELQTMKGNAMKQFAISEQEMNRQMLMLRSFVKYSQEIIDKSSAFDVAIVSDDLEKKATELQITSIISALPAPDIIFSSQEVVDAITVQKFNIVGIIALANYPAGK